MGAGAQQLLQLLQQRFFLQQLNRLHFFLQQRFSQQRFSQQRRSQQRFSQQDGAGAQQLGAGAGAQHVGAAGAQHVFAGAQQPWSAIACEAVAQQNSTAAVRVVHFMSSISS